MLINIFCTVDRLCAIMAVSQNGRFGNSHYGERQFWNTAILTHGHSGKSHCGKRLFWEQPLWETAIVGNGNFGNGH